jgi:hypothetical protein
MPLLRLHLRQSHFSHWLLSYSLTTPALKKLQFLSVSDVWTKYDARSLWEPRFYLDDEPFSSLPSLTQISVQSFFGIDLLLSQLRHAPALHQLSLLGHFSFGYDLHRQCIPSSYAVLKLLRRVPQLHVRLAKEFTQKWWSWPESVARLEVHKNKLIQVQPKWFAQSPNA